MPTLLQPNGRTWAYKTAYASGTWGVRVTDSGGEELVSTTFNVRETRAQKVE